MKRKTMVPVLCIAAVAGVAVTQILADAALAPRHWHDLRDGLWRWIAGWPDVAVASLPLYGLVLLLVAAIVFSNARISAAVDLLRKTHQREVETAHAALFEQRRAAVNEQLARPGGWSAVAGQLIADALGETVTIDADAGLIDVAATPAPRFTACASDGRAFTFTVNPPALRRHGLLPRRARCIDFSALSLTHVLDAQTLWESLNGASKSAAHTAVPRRFGWHVVVVPSPCACAPRTQRSGRLQARMARLSAALRPGWAPFWL